MIFVYLIIILNDSTIGWRFFSFYYKNGDSWMDKGKPTKTKWSEGQMNGILN